ncbi:helix-turn-helix domain-containing protein [Idiomarina xiamenensis]|uniref:AraC family transcriptional regulator n=1 Tax=Idiomarina xiamenensis 10-D-4 TaxID=740709 RepID=K2JFN9_9GAMM|nr:AraC family transcriptional regulator [Idiomarina xiamenensis]EKE82111.1 araC family transcriptional regulator [Idiomarina xiamenensis 10-D-4]
MNIAQHSFDYESPAVLAHISVLPLIELLQQRQIGLHEVLTGTCLFAEQLAKANARITVSQWLQVINNINRLYSNAQPNDLLMLLASQLTAHAALPIAQLLNNAPNLRSMLHHWQRFNVQWQPLQQLTYHCHQQLCDIHWRPTVGLHQQAQRVDELSVSLMLRLLKKYRLQSGVVALEWPYPKDRQHSAYQAFWGLNPIYQGQRVQLRIQRQLLDQPLINTRYRQAALQQCELQQRLLGYRHGTLTILRQAIQQRLPIHYELEQAANERQLSISSLKRLLKKHGMSFSTLNDQLRYHIALNSLARESNSKRVIAQQLGYSDKHNFRRAWRRWVNI